MQQQQKENRRSPGGDHGRRPGDSRGRISNVFTARPRVDVTVMIRYANPADAAVAIDSLEERIKEAFADFAAGGSTEIRIPGMEITVTYERPAQVFPDNRGARKVVIDGPEAEEARAAVLGDGGKGRGRGRSRGRGAADKAAADAGSPKKGGAHE